MSRITRILAAVDLADVRDAAFHRALAVARASKADLYLLHAVPSNDRFSWGAAQRFHRMNDLRRRAEVEGLSVQTDEQHGDPAGVIALHADARGVDSIVMGTNGRNGWQRLREHSSPNACSGRTSRPVLVVPNGGEDPVGDEPFRNIVVAVDSSPAGMANVDEAMRLAGGVPDRRRSCTLSTASTLNHVWESPHGGRFQVPPGGQRRRAATPEGIHAIAPASDGKCKGARRDRRAA